ncbi:hypothetical protein DesLBE_0089 [Desulfitobacterium sp. LBE]|nr:hypothetical protein DesLBE_0089 [Desulfitobacterium sp. LBE]
MNCSQGDLLAKICASSDLHNIQKYLNEVLLLRGFERQSAQDKKENITREWK